MPTAPDVSRVHVDLARQPYFCLETDFMPTFQLIMHIHKDVSLRQFQVNACLFYNIARQPFTCFASRHIMKRYLGLKSKSLEDVVGLIALVLALEFAA